MANYIKLASDKLVFSDSEQSDVDLDSLVKCEGLTTLPAGIDLGTPKTDTIAESSSGVGVTIDGVLIKDSLDGSGIVTKTTAQTLTGKKTMGAVVQTVTTYTPAASGTATLDVSVGNIHSITMPAGNITIAISNETAGQCFMIEITQDGTGSRTVTWFTTIKWAGGSAPTLTTTGSKRDVFGFRVTSADNYLGYVIGQNL